MIVDLSSGLKGRDAVSALSASFKKKNGGGGGRRVLHIDTHIHTSKMQNEALCRVWGTPPTW